MSHHLHFVLLSGAPPIAGLLLLHLATRKESNERGHIGLGRGIALLLAGLLLVALPLAVWSRSLLEPSPQPGHHVSPASVFMLAGYLNAVFIWLIWNINAYAFRLPGAAETPWDENWGATYSPELKRRLLSPVLDRLDAEGGIGELIIDVGSGAAPVSKLLPSASGRKFILIDIAAENRVSSDSLYLNLNAENIARPDLLSSRKALTRVARFLGLDSHSPASRECAATIVFSDILNYVDYRKVISGFATFLKPGGRIIIINLPGRGIREQFSEMGLKHNGDLYPFLCEQNLAVEYKDFPCRPQGATDEAEELIVLVARKTN